MLAMETIQAEETAELIIQDFTPKGYGLAQWPRPAPLPPLQVEVAHALPGDTIQAAMRKKMRGVRKGRLLEVIAPSCDRISPPCKHAQICGGCCWQQMAYGAQLKEKEARIKKIFGSMAPIEPILGAEKIFGYRNKMEFSFSENRAGMRYLGLMIAQAEPYVFNVEECHLASPWFAEILQAVRAWWEKTGVKAYHPHRDEGALRYLTLREAVRTGQKMAILNVSGNAEFALTRFQLDLFVQTVQEALFGDEISLFLRIHQTKKGKPTQFFEMHLAGPDHIVEELRLARGALSFKISPISFFQPNTLQAEKLYDTALAMIEALQPTTVFDLYCGTGTLAMAASRFAQRVIGIELSAEAVLDAEENLERNAIQNCRFIQGDVGKVLTRLIDEGVPKPNVVIVDPPRAGLDALALSHLKKLMPQAILYISCNPLTQADNIQELIRCGYRLERLQPIDQFPHTYHIENIALLVYTNAFKNWEFGNVDASDLKQRSDTEAAQLV